MKLAVRIGYYLGGFSIGLVILAFFFNGKNTSCAYGAEARVLKNLRSKRIVFQPSAQEELLKNFTDTTGIYLMFVYGDIDFSKSESRLKPCGLYHIKGKLKNRDIALKVENCDSLAKITKVLLNTNEAPL